MDSLEILYMAYIEFFKESERVHAHFTCRLYITSKLAADLASAGKMDRRLI